jgi:hypothetical protein
MQVSAHPLWADLISIFLLVPSCNQEREGVRPTRETFIKRITASSGRGMPGFQAVYLNPIWSWRHPELGNRARGHRHFSNANSTSCAPLGGKLAGFSTSPNSSCHTPIV